MSARTITEPLDGELDPNVYKQRAALIEARRIMRLPEEQAQQAIAHLILNHVVQDVNRAAKIAALANGGRN